MNGLLVRDATEVDLEALNGLYNHYVEASAVTFDIEPTSMEARRAWFAQFSPAGRHRLLVATRDGRLVGYAGSHVFRARRAYETSVETTIYVAHDAGRSGVGRALYEALFAALRGEDVHRAYAGITLPNEASVALHEGFGFRPVGTFDEVGRKFGRFWSVGWFEKELAPAAAGAQVGRKS